MNARAHRRLNTSILLAAAAGLLLPAAAFADLFEWSPTNGTTWNKAENWKRDGVQQGARGIVPGVGNNTHDVNIGSLVAPYDTVILDAPGGVVTLKSFSLTNARVLGKQGAPVKIWMSSDFFMTNGLRDKAKIESRANGGASGHIEIVSAGGDISIQGEVRPGPPDNNKASGDILIQASGAGKVVTIDGVVSASNPASLGGPVTLRALVGRIEIRRQRLVAAGGGLRAADDGNAENGLEENGRKLKIEAKEFLNEGMAQSGSGGDDMTFRGVGGIGGTLELNVESITNRGDLKAGDGGLAGEARNDYRLHGGTGGNGGHVKIEQANTVVTNSGSITGGTGGGAGEVRETGGRGGVGGKTTINIRRLTNQARSRIEGGQGGRAINGGTGGDVTIDTAAAVDFTNNGMVNGGRGGNCPAAGRPGNGGNLSVNGKEMKVGQLMGGFPGNDPDGLAGRMGALAINAERRVVLGATDAVEGDSILINVDSDGSFQVLEGEPGEHGTITAANDIEVNLACGATLDVSAWDSGEGAVFFCGEPGGEPNQDMYAPDIDQIVKQQGVSFGQMVRADHSPYYDVGCSSGCPADFTGDGALNIFDFLAFQTAFGNADPAADLAAPFGTFNLFDFLAFQTAFGNGC